MEHSKNFEKIQAYYRRKLWTTKMVWNVVDKDLGITEAEYQEITGLTYPAME